MLIEYLLKRESTYLEGIELTVGLNHSGNIYTDLPCPEKFRDVKFNISKVRNKP